MKFIKQKDHEATYIASNKQQLLVINSYLR